MKTKQTTIPRSGAKWLPGAMALAATTASSQAATVQITLTGNMISSSGGNQLYLDLTGDDTPDIGFESVEFTGNWAIGRVRIPLFGGFSMGTFRAQYNGVARLFYNKPMFYSAGVGSGGFNASPIASSAVALNRFYFTDIRINGGAITEAWLEVNAFNESKTSHTVQLTRLIFDDGSTTRPAFSSIPGEQPAWTAVPEPSSFALLGLGAAGLLARRRRQAA
jgi:hypothetical protein